MRFPEADCDEWPELAAYLGRSDPDRWRDVVLLAGGIKAAKEPGPVWRLVDALTPDQALAERLTPEDAWGLRLAGEVLADNLERGRLTPKRQRILERARGGLPALLPSSVLKAAERVTAGLHLAVLGDPRREAVEVAATEFCLVPAGRFFLGATDVYVDEKEGAGDYDLDYAYWLARFPVTVAQFRRFVEDTAFQPGDSGCLRAPTHMPVVYVSWDEAQAFCDWLSARWGEQGWWHAGWGAVLPSESEWEKAAKGGYEIPEAALIRSVSAIGGQREATPAMVTNSEPRRPYPWGGGGGHGADELRHAGRPGLAGGGLLQGALALWL